MYRIKLRYAGRDRRETLRKKTALSTEERLAIQSRLDRYDRSSRVGPWTKKVLALLARHPEVSAGELAEISGLE